ncbi:hypothetical protein DAPPUDRAFT_108237 [Daphnia pulex]|uniref:Uncharacterized protein n=1 Tax=Daphnia pulex TaxID=6669 RepID=E9GZJ7_DAPPU|nr:hypothetical protein DAPPUDRAFT_108237 [Daphnia pulex]|eukprot:EFX75093.1 hypothetical protein DAPPUDRAFT_108237 [Daphnia pulex]
MEERGGTAQLIGWRCCCGGGRDQIAACKQEHLEPDCILQDHIEGNWYNSYTSIKHSTAEKSLYMAFNSNTGSPCRLRLKSETASDGRSIVALGSNEKYALFFPVRNISLPDGMNLTSLIQLNKRIPFAKNSVKPTGCAPRCSKSSDQSIKETSSNRASSKEKSKRKNKCSCLSSETPAQGGGNVERCRRPRQCRPNPGQHARKSHRESSGSSSSGSSNMATESGWNQLKRPDRHREKKSRNNKKRMTTENSSASSDLPSAESRPSPVNRLEIDPPPVKWMVESGSSQTASAAGKNPKKLTPTTTTTHQDASAELQRHKLKNHRGKKTSLEDRSATDAVISNPSKSRGSDSGRQDRTLRLPHRKSDSRLIRHRYRKIRAHPELAEQLDAIS